MLDINRRVARVVRVGRPGFDSLTESHQMTLKRYQFFTQLQLFIQLFTIQLIFTASLLDVQH